MICSIKARYFCFTKQCIIFFRYDKCNFQNIWSMTLTRQTEILLYSSKRGHNTFTMIKIIRYSWQTIFFFMRLLIKRGGYLRGNTGEYMPSLTIWIPCMTYCFFLTKISWTSYSNAPLIKLESENAMCNDVKVNPSCFFLFFFHFKGKIMDDIKNELLNFFFKDKESGSCSLFFFFMSQTFFLFISFFLSFFFFCFFHSFSQFFHSFFFQLIFSHISYYFFHSLFCHFFFESPSFFYLFFYTLCFFANFFSISFTFFFKPQ